MIKLLIFLLALSVIAIAIIRGFLTKIRNSFFEGLKGENSGKSRGETEKEKVLYQKDDVIVLKGEAKSDKKGKDG